MPASRSFEACLKTPQLNRFRARVAADDAAHDEDKLRGSEDTLGCNAKAPTLQYFVDAYLVLRHRRRRAPNTRRRLGLITFRRCKHHGRVAQSPKHYWACRQRRDDGHARGALRTPPRSADYAATPP